MSRAKLLLDVDGVLNPDGVKRHIRPHGYETFRWPVPPWTLRKPLRVWLSPEHGPMLRRFAELHDVELVWCTTWEHHANTYVGPAIGLPELPVIEFGEHPPGHTPGWKYPAVTAFAPHDVLIWLDDEHKAIGQGRLHALEEFNRDRGDVPTLLHLVDPRIGLTILDLNQIGRWLDREVPRSAEEAS